MVFFFSVPGPYGHAQGHQLAVRCSKGGTVFAKRKKPTDFSVGFSILGGERGIRTPGTSQFNGFQDRRYRPLSHLSKRQYDTLSFSKRCKVTKFFLFCKPFRGFFIKNRLLCLTAFIHQCSPTNTRECQDQFVLHARWYVLHAAGLCGSASR